MKTARTGLARTAGALLVTVALVGSLAACSGQASADTATNKVTVGAHSNGVAKETTLTVDQVDKIRAELPESVRKSGKLVIGLSALPSGFPPLGYQGDDQKTLTGSEPDLGRLIAAVFGLKPEVKNATWDNLFVGIDTGATDVGLSNITDTEQRKQKYDFASYRQDNLGFEVLKKNKWNFDGDYTKLAGLNVSVSAGTNQEKLLLEWQTKLRAEGKDFTIKYFPTSNGTYLALDSGQIDAIFTPNPSIIYHAVQTAKSANPTRDAGTFSGAGTTLQGLIAATTKKDNGLAKPLADAINHLIDGGQYGALLKAYNLTNESVKKSLINPPGLPLSNS
jgi:polar amino acid transport system substrate-binding protein